MTPTTERRILFLDALRVFAFVSVLAGHKFYGHVALLADGESLVGRLLGNLALPMIYGGGAGVVVFFLVSGYIITHVLQTEATSEFLIKRVFRIYPLYMAAVLMHSAFLFFLGNAVPWTTLLLQLLLVGDLFGTPYALAGVEWTLRLEVAFYLLMAGVFSFRRSQHFRLVLPYGLLAVAPVLALLGPFPHAGAMSAYFTLYFPFLLIGSMAYLAERQLASWWVFTALSAVVFAQYYWGIWAYQPAWTGAHFAPLAFAIFLCAWLVRGWFRRSALLLVLSDLTFGVYLFHNWLFDYFKRAFVLAGIHVGVAHFLALVPLLIFCYVMVRAVEKPGVRLGRAVSTGFKVRNGKIPAPRSSYPR
jgi:peptidoglycan/LPS O-acetylase OafA/YrhL